MRPGRVGWALLLGLALLVPGRAGAQGIEVTDDEVNRIARQLYCPVCENVPLDVCPTQACEQWREMIRRLLADGRTEEEIKEYFVAQYGARVLATPPATGLNWLVYLLPPVAFLAGAVILWRALRRWGRTVETSLPEEPREPASDPYVARVEEALRRRGG